MLCNPTPPPRKVSIRSFLSKHTHTLLSPHTTHSKLILSLLTHFTKNSDGASVDWLTLINPGQPIFGDDNWTVSKRNRYPLFDNFTSARLVKSNDTIIKVICTITQSTLKSPIFSCKCYKYIPEENSFECQHYFFLSLLKITPLVNNLLKRICADSKRRWPGFDFFGFNLKNVRIILDKCIVLTIFRGKCVIIGYEFYFVRSTSHNNVVSNLQRASTLREK